MYRLCTHVHEADGRVAIIASDFYFSLTGAGHIPAVTRARLLNGLRSVLFDPVCPCHNLCDSDD